MKTLTYLLSLLLLTITLSASEAPLKTGWNLIGINSTDSVSNLAVNTHVLKAAGGGVGGGGDFKYDKAFAQYATGSMKLGQGYWIKTDSDTNLTYTESTTQPTSITLLEGWNLINTCKEINASLLLTDYPYVLKAAGGGVGGGGDFRYDKNFAQYASGVTKVGQGYWFMVDTPFTLECNSTVKISSNICSNSKLTFNTLEFKDTLNPWVEGNDGLLNRTKLHWNPIKDAQQYTFDMKLEGYYEITDINAYKGTNIRFDYDENISGYNLSYLNSDIIMSSSSFDVNSTVIITLRALDSTGNTIVQSNPISFEIAKSYLSLATNKIWANSFDSSIGIDWCAVNDATNYTIKYGTSISNLDNNIRNIDTNTLMQTINNLNNDTAYYFSIAALNSNGNGKFSEAIKVTPSLNNTLVDLSVDKVVFNQTVQIDLDNNQNGTPIIANKPGVLRIFVNSDSLVQYQKVEIMLGGSSNGKILQPIIKEVALSNTPYSSYDSSNNVLYFDINSSEWMSEGTSFYILIDPNNKITESDKSNNRYPLSAEQTFGFENRYKMQIKLIPVLTSVGKVTLSQEIVDGVKEYIKSIYPLSDVIVTVGNELNASSRTPADDSSVWSDILDDISQQKNIEVASDSSQEDIFYYGVIDKVGNDTSGLSGLAYTNAIENFDYSTYKPQLIGVGRIDEIGLNIFYETLAHEIGHNHGRLHVNNIDETNDNCSVPSSVDNNYSYNTTSAEFGRIGRTGFSNLNNTLYEKSYYHDIMSYCDRVWISDYTYKGLYEFEDKLDTLYNRSVTSNARFITTQQSRTLGQMIAGKITLDKDGKNIYTLSKKYVILWNDTISQETTQFYALITLNNLNTFEIPFIPNSLDHSNIKKFEFFIPSQEEISSIIIKDRKNLTEFILR